MSVSSKKKAPSSNQVGHSRVGRKNSYILHSLSHPLNQLKTLLSLFCPLTMQLAKPLCQWVVQNGAKHCA
jgi:hypothetical protein